MPKHPHPTHAIALALPLLALTACGALAQAERLQPTDLTYRGAFRLPGGSGGSSWEYGGDGLTYYPGGDPSGPADGYPGSLFGVGHDWDKYVSEITIPAPVISANKRLADLPRARTLQPFQDVRAGVGELANLQEIPRVGIEYLPAQGAQQTGKLYLCWGAHLQEGAEHRVASHMWCDLDLTDPRGAWWIGNYSPYSANDYLFEIAEAWATANTPGLRLATGRFRDGGWGGQGPSLFACGPWNHGNPPAPNTRLDATPLLLYSSTATDNPPYHTLTGYHHSDEWSGGAWVTSGNRAAVAFVGTKGTGKCWYGLPDGTVWPEEPPYPPDPQNQRGWWSTGFVGRIVFYDPADLAAVARGAMEPYEPQPYASLDIDRWLYAVTSTQQKQHVRDVCFDRRRGLLYLVEHLADGDRPLVHVWQVGSAGPQPDAMIRIPGERPWTGNDVHNRTGAGQTRRRRAPGTAAVYGVRVQNDGAARERLRVCGTAGDREWYVTYWRGTTNITSEVTGSGWLTRHLPPGAAARIRVRVRPRPRAPDGGRKVVFVTCISQAQSTKRDVVKAVTSVPLRLPPPPTVIGLAATPSSSGAQIVVFLSAPATVRARALNLAGRPVATICLARECAAGTSTLVWDARADNGLPVPNGTYLMELTAASEGGSSSRGLAHVRLQR